MKNHQAAVASCLIFIAIFFLPGCQGNNFIHRGDAAALLNQHTAALGYYQQALAINHRLGNNPEFQKKLIYTRSRANYQSAQNATHQKDWPSAIRNYQAALQDDATFTDAKNALLHAKKQYAKHTYARALNLVDQDGRINQAEPLLKQTLVLDPQHPHAQRAIDSLLPAAFQEPMYLAVFKNRRQKKWKQIIARADDLLQTQPHLLPLRQQRHHAKQQIRASKQAYRLAAKSLQSKQIDIAIGHTQTALRHWPYHPDAGPTLVRAKRLRAAADTFYQRAVAAGQKKSFDSGIALLKKSLALFPNHPQAKPYRSTLLGQGASHHTQVGQSLFHQKKYHPAHASYEKALGYQPNHFAAIQGKAAIYAAYARQSLLQNLPGQSFIWAKKAHQLEPIASHQKLITHAQNKIYQRAAFQLKLKLSYADTLTARQANLFHDTTKKYLKRHRLAYFHLKPKADDLPIITAHTHLKVFQVHTKEIQSLNQKHRYQVSLQVPNPKVAILTAELEHAEDRLCMLNRRFQKCCPTCRGKFQRLCRHCHGRAKIIRNFCNTCQIANCRVPKHRSFYIQKTIACPHCTQGQIYCTQCRGTGRLHWSVTQKQLNHLTNQTIRLRRRLGAMPLTIAQLQERQWPYTLKTYRLTAHLQGDLTLQTPDQLKAKSISINQSASIQDSTIIGHHPGIGLNADPLTLPEPNVFLKTLALKTAQKTAIQIIKTTTLHRADEMLGLSDALKDKKQMLASQEAAIAAALLYQHASAHQGKKMIRQFMKIQKP